MFLELFDEHYDASGCDEGGAEDDFGADLLLQQQERQKDGDDHAELVYGRHARHISLLYSFEIEQPGQARGYARQYQKQPDMTRNAADIGTVATCQDYAPGDKQYYRGAYRRGKIGIDIADADFGENRRQCGKECREQYIIFSHILKAFCLAMRKY